MLVRLPETDARVMLQSKGVARLGCILNGEPYIVPINYFVEDNYAYSHSLPGLKIEALRRNPSACLQTDDLEEGFRWRSVLAFGKYEEIRKTEERELILGKLLRRFPMLTPVESAIAEDGGPPSAIVFRIRIERITGLAET
jgi:nitroimidazol reductase NimA-like FMN-containing flavoprotein (pyridoxamine 5'-phosphate oxidase superfamily)